jgi:hypothetical protein
MKSHFENVQVTSNISDIQKNDVVVVINHLQGISVLKQYYRQKLIYWWQGLAPEEIIFGKTKLSLRTRLQFWSLSFIEFLLINKSYLNIFVSESMKKHYTRKLGYKRDNYVIMPCFNQQIASNSFYVDGKYDNPSFVYAGGILPWQCVEESLQLYGMVKSKYSNATMTILTKQHEEAKALVEKYGLKDVCIKFVPLEQLNGELAKYKYGMLLRKDDIVNNVATPTKFNSYLAAGIIPIICQVIGDYESITNKMEYAVCVKDEKDIQTAFDKIDKLESQQILPQNVLLEYKRIFDDYYNESKYIGTISRKLQSIFPNIHSKE